MFPLGTVLFPYGVLPLHVFEDRYRELVRHCLDGDRQLGIVLIERGSEVGGGDVRFGVGTRARIVEALPLDDGRWYLVLLGVDRIRVVRWLPEKPFPRAEVDVLAEEGDGDASRREEVERLLRRALALKAELDEPAASATVPLDPSSDLAVWQAATRAPLGPADAQRVLEAPSAGDRFRLLETLLEEEVAVLDHRVAGG